MKSSSNLLKKSWERSPHFCCRFSRWASWNLLILQTTHFSTSNTESKQVHSTTVKTAYKNTTSTSEAVDKVKKCCGFCDYLF